MATTLKECRPILDDAAWASVMAQFADASIYQTRAYGTARWSAAKLRHLLELDETTAVVAAAQVLVERVPLSGVGIAYVPYGPMWRVTAVVPNLGRLRSFLRLCRDHFCINRGYLLRVQPNAFSSLDDGVHEAFIAEGFAPTQAFPERSTLLIDLRTPEDQLRKEMKQNWRYNLGRAERRGLQIILDGSDSAFTAFSELYSEMQDRKQFESNVEVGVFRRAQKQLPHEQKLDVLTCRANGANVGALILARRGDTAIPILSATSPAGRTLGAAYLLRWEALKIAMGAGCRWFDQGGVNAMRNPGGYQFKTGMGGQHAQRLGAYEACISARRRSAILAAEASARRLFRFFKRLRQIRTWKTRTASSATPADAAG